MEMDARRGVAGARKTPILQGFLWRSVYGNKRYQGVTKSGAGAGKSRKFAKNFNTSQLVPVIVI